MSYLYSGDSIRISGPWAKDGRAGIAAIAVITSPIYVPAR